MWNPLEASIHSWKEVILEHGALLVYLSIRQRDTRTQACKERDCDTSRYRVSERYITPAARSEIDRLWPRRKVNPAPRYNSSQLRPQRRTAIRGHGVDRRPGLNNQQLYRTGEKNLLPYTKPHEFYTVKQKHIPQPADVEHNTVCGSQAKWQIQLLTFPSISRLLKELLATLYTDWLVHTDFN